MQKHPSEITTYIGNPNASGAVALDKKYFVVGDDEKNQLSIYRKDKLEEPVQTIELTSVFKGKISKSKSKGLEFDLESAAEIDGTLFWIGSHSCDGEGKLRLARHRLFAINIQEAENKHFVANPVGEIYTSLIEDLVQDPRFDAYRLDKAKTIQPKAVGGLSIEGLAATPEKSLLIGFRNPLAGGEEIDGRLEKGRALIIELLNPFEVIQKLKARFSKPIELDLDGYGIREITRRKKHKYLIVAGPYHEQLAALDPIKQATRLYKWSSKSGKIKCLESADLLGLNIEAALFYRDDDDCVQLLSDDGKLENAGGFRNITINL